MTPVARLRAHSAPAHDMVDAAFGGYDLTAAASYRRFLHAHALALPAAERWLVATPGLPGWRERTSLLAADLAALGEAMPVPLDLVIADRPGAAWGALYVTEGSRLGGIMLSRTVSAGLPARYLGARHGSGEWRGLLAAIDEQGTMHGDDWVEGAMAGATACFALYRRAAAATADDRG